MAVATQRQHILRMAHEYWNTHACATTEEVVSYISAAVTLKPVFATPDHLRSILRPAGTSRDLASERHYDDTIEQSFPASDPPPSP